MLASCYVRLLQGNFRIEVKFLSLDSKMKLPSFLQTHTEGEKNPQSRGCPHPISRYSLKFYISGSKNPPLHTHTFTSSAAPSTWRVLSPIIIIFGRKSKSFQILEACLLETMPASKKMTGELCVYLMSHTMLTFCSVTLEILQPGK